MNKLLSKHIIGIAIVFIATFAIFLALEFNSGNPYFSGYDSFYHVGMAEHIMNEGLPHQFPYLYYTTLNEHFTDNHLLFHMLLIPFILIFGNVAGPKIFIALCFGLIFALLYVFLRKLNFTWALPFTLVAFALEPSDFYFRQAFIRNPAPSLLFLLLALFLLYRKKLWFLTILAFLYGWLYTGGGFLFLLALLGIYAVTSWIMEKKLDLKLVLYPAAAVILSLVINPYFPENVKSVFLQVWQTGLMAKEYSGGEWYPYDTWFWLSISYIPLTIWVAGIVIALYKRLPVSRISWTVFLFSIFLLVMQWKSKRFVEYWPFFAIISGILLAGKQVEEYVSSVIISPILSSRASRLRRDPGSRKNLESIAILLLVATLLVTSYFYASSQWSRAWRDTSSTNDFNVDAARAAHDYLKNNSQPGDIVFTDDWDVFPLYFFLNQKDYYIVGLDPEFMNQFDPKLYTKFAAISSGMSVDNIGEIKTTFKAKWVIVAADHPEFRNNLRSQPELFSEVFSNKEYWVFQVK
ncbi:MAG: hypothetical protein V1690_03575 [Candidatus Moraniibacteriota bacterium]